MINKEDIRKYNAIRPEAARGKLCHAPSVNLNFEQNGNVTACCFNRTDVLGRYPQQTLKEIWESKEAQRLREQIEEGSLGGGCKLCGILLESGNYQGTKAVHYDEFATPKDTKKRVLNWFRPSSGKKMPRVFEFEISNTCNLQCEMCNGYFSSTIRKQREKLPPIANPYDDAFVDQAAEFMPYLTDLKFLGGEPFLIDIYYQIWERVIAVNPNIRIHVTTNGTVFNNRVKEIMSKLRMGLVVSIDSIDPKEFESIRLGASLQKVLENFSHFKKMTEERNTYLTIAACAMSNNWKGIPNLVRFANEQQIPVHFNVVWNPGHLSIRYMNYTELEKVLDYFDRQNLPESGHIEQRNRSAFMELVNTVRHWKNERSELGLEEMDNFGGLSITSPEYLNLTPEMGGVEKDLAGQLLWHFAQRKTGLHAALISAGFSSPEMGDDDNMHIRKRLFDIWKTTGDSRFFQAYFSILPYLAGSFFGKSGFELVQERAKAILEHIEDMRRQQAMISDLIDDIDRRSVVNHLQLIHANPIEKLLAHLDEHY